LYVFNGAIHFALRKQNLILSKTAAKSRGFLVKALFYFWSWQFQERNWWLVSTL